MALLTRRAARYPHRRQSPTRHSRWPQCTGSYTQLQDPRRTEGRLRPAGSPVHLQAGISSSHKSQYRARCTCLSRYHQCTTRRRLGSIPTWTCQCTSRALHRRLHSPYQCTPQRPLALWGRQCQCTRPARCRQCQSTLPIDLPRSWTAAAHVLARPAAPAAHTGAHLYRGAYDSASVQRSKHVRGAHGQRGRAHTVAAAGRQHGRLVLLRLITAISTLCKSSALPNSTGVVGSDDRAVPVSGPECRCAAPGFEAPTASSGLRSLLVMTGCVAAGASRGSRTE